MAFVLSLSLVQNSFAAITNTATASGNYGVLPVVSGTSSASVPVTPNAPRLELLKSSVFNDESGDGFAQVGETIAYAFSIRNAGNVTLTNVTVNDPTVTVTGGPIASLAPGAVDSTTMQATYTLLAADVVAGTLINTATATGTPPTGPAVSDVSDSQNPGDDTGADNDPTHTNFANSPINAVDDNFSATPVNGLGGGNTLTVFANDTLAGVAFANVDVVATLVSNGGLVGAILNSNGTIAVPAGTTAGSYTVNYRICEALNLTNCDTANAIVLVNSATILANDDDFSATPLNGFVGGSTPTVYVNDTLNGTPFVNGAVTRSIVTDGGLIGVAINSDGTLNVPGPNAGGIYLVTYRICEVLNGANCDNAVATVVINPPAIVANDDDFTAAIVSGFSGGTTVTIYTNDTVNGASFAAGTVNPVITNNGGIAGLTVNASGALVIPAGVPAGPYTATYRICENLNPANCDIATVLLQISMAVIDAVNDDFSAVPVDGVLGGISPTVYTNDTLNGLSFVPTDVTPLVIANGGIAGLAINPADGTLVVPAGTLGGTYTITYRICEVLNPTNCDTADTILMVDAPTIYANNDNYTGAPINGLIGGTTASVYPNDTLNGAAFAPGDVIPTIVADGGILGISINPATGELDVPAATPAGTYSVDYQICEAAQPANCDTAVVAIQVNPAVIDAVNDDFSALPVNGFAGGTTSSVYINDTLNGVVFPPAAVLPSIISNGGISGLAINPVDGALSIPAGRSAGTYTASYRICEVLNPANCDTANVTIVITAAAIDALNDDFTAVPVNGMSGGSTPSIYTNDTLNAVGFAPSAVTPTLINNGGLAGLTINPATGALAVPTATPAGTYTAAYRICEVLNPANCDTATATVVVLAAVIDAVDNDFSATPVNGATGGTTTTVFANDMLNGAGFPASAVSRTLLNDGGIAGLLLNSNGTLSIPAGRAANTYTAIYRICEVLNPTNCDNANAIVTIAAPVIDAVSNDFSSVPIDSAAGGSTTSVYLNDTLNAAPFAAGQVSPTLVSNGGIAGLSINPATGALVVPAGIAAGTYTASYQICENLNPTNCDTATAIVRVTVAVIDAVNDDFSAVSIPGYAGGTTPGVFANDTLNAAPFANAAVIVTLVADGGLVGLTVNGAGVLVIPAGAATGTYTATYRICQATLPSNCDQANAVVVVDNNAILKGTVFHDANGNGILDGDPLAGAGYIVQLFDSSGALVGQTTTLANSQYTMNVLPGAGYKLVFRDPAGGIVGGTPGLTLVPGPQVQDQNQPIDPSGIVYNSVTRMPVAGVTVTLTDGSNTPLPAVCLIDASQQDQITNATGEYRFDIVPGSDAACPLSETEYRVQIANPPVFLPGFSVVMPPQAGSLEATACTIDPSLGGACQVSPSAAPPVAPASGVYFSSFLLENGDGNVVNNHVAIDPVISTTSAFTKTALVKEARRGERVPFVIEASDLSFNPVRIIDIMPPGFNYVNGSAISNGVPVVPVINGQTLTFNGLLVDGAAHVKLELTLISNAAVTTGPHVNTAELHNPLTDLLVETARATVTIVAEHVFDCSDLIGRVFDDKNRDGYQDKGEPGLAGVRLATVKGVLITTDKSGLFHVACADTPDSDIGSNFILKLDTRTLPTGYHLTTENPAMVRLTRGKMTKMNFGAATIRQVKFDMTNEAFVSGSVELKPQWKSAINQLIGVLKKEDSTLKLTYFAKTSGSKLASDRAAAVSKLIAERWAAESGHYKLPIETRVVGSK